MKNTCKIVSALLITILALTVATPVFAETKQSTVSYEAPETFTWSVTDSVNIGQDIEVALDPEELNIYNDTYITVELTSSTNYEEGKFYLKSASNDTVEYCLTLKPAYQDNGPLINTLHYTVLDMPRTTVLDCRIGTSWANGAPTRPGTYTDVLKFTAELHSHGITF